MFNFKLIKEHNENMNKAYSTISNYKGEKAAIINGVAKIFNATPTKIIPAKINPGIIYLNELGKNEKYFLYELFSAKNGFYNKNLLKDNTYI